MYGNMRVLSSGFVGAGAGAGECDGDTGWDFGWDAE